MTTPEHCLYKQDIQQKFSKTDYYLIRNQQGQCSKISSAQRAGSLNPS